MNKYPLEDGLSDEYDEPTGGLTEEERERMEDLIRRGELEPGPDLLERYVHPFTGEVIREGGPDTPEARAEREEIERSFWQRMKEESSRKRPSDS